MRILVPTDFSFCAEAAYGTAAQLARDARADLLLLHDAAADLVFDGNGTEVDARKNLARTAALPVFAGLSPRTVLGQGPLVELVVACAEENDVDLIVMGSHGASGINERLLGSNTQKVVRLAPCHVLAVKSPPEKTSFKSVVFASSFEDEALPLFLELLEFVEPYEAHLHLLHVVRPGFFVRGVSEIRQAMDEFAAQCPKGRCSRHLFHAESPESGIHTFLGAVHADLLCTAHYGQEPLRRLFQYSLTEALVNHTEIPVLCLHGRRFS